MALNSTGKLSLGGTVEGESVSLELGLVADATNSMVSSANQLLTGKTTGPWVFPDDWRGKANVILAFGNSDTFDVRQTQVNGLGYAFLTFSQDGSVSKIGNTKSQGPNSWLYPIGSAGSNYEIRLIVDAVDTSLADLSSFSFAGVAVPAPATTGYNNLGSPGAGVLTIISGSTKAISSASGTVEIRRVGFGAPMISRAFYIEVVHPTYEFGAYSTSVNEGGSITFTVNTTNIANGTNLSWAVSSSSDITEPTGTFAINNNTGQFVLTIAADITTEGAETFTVGIYAGMTLVVTSNSITINDTSISYNESVSGPATTDTNVAITISVSGGAPNTGFSYAGAASGSATLDASGNYTFSGISYATAGTYNYTITFAASGNVRTYSVIASAPYVPPGNDGGGDGISDGAAAAAADGAAADGAAADGAAADGGAGAGAGASDGGAGASDGDGGGDG